jgi:allantoin racemase
MRSVLVITPAVDTGAIEVEPSLQPFRSERIAVTNVFIDDGPASIETEADVEACLPGVMRVARSPVAVAADAIVINCMCDPGVEQLRHMFDKPVLGAAQTSMHVAASLGTRFAVLDVLAEGRDYVERQVEQFGLRAHYASHRALGIPVLELYSDVERTLAALTREATLATTVDGASTLLFGCTGLAQLADEFNAGLGLDQGRYRLIEPLRVTLGAACALALTG